jgi:hypothetical protein
LEAIDDAGIDEKLAPDLLEHDHPIQGGLVGEVDDTHPTLADLADDLEAAHRLRRTGGCGGAHYDFSS